TQQRLVIRERDHVHADVPRWKDAGCAAQPAGVSAVVRDGDTGGDIHDEGFRRGKGIVPRNDEVFEAAEKRGKSRDAAEGYDVQTAGVFKILLFHTTSWRS